MRKKLGTCNNQMHAIRDKEGNVVRNTDKVVEVGEQFYKDLYRVAESIRIVMHKRVLQKNLKFNQ